MLAGVNKVCNTCTPPDIHPLTHPPTTMSPNTFRPASTTFTPSIFPVFLLP